MMSETELKLDDKRVQFTAVTESSLHQSDSATNIKENGVSLALLETNIVTKSTTTDKTKSIAERIPAYGLILVLISVFFFSLQAVIVKTLTQLNPIQILSLRFGFQFIIYSIAALIQRHPLLGSSDSRIYLAIRCIAGTVSLATIYEAYRLMPIADAATINFSSPVFVIIIAYFLLKEPISIIHIITGTFTLFGVVLIGRPEFLFGKESDSKHERRLEGTILAIIAAITLAMVQISLRKLKNTPVVITLMWFGGTCFVMGFGWLYMFDNIVMPTGWRTWGLLSLCFFSGLCDQYFYTLAFHYENAGPIAITRTFDIVLSFAWGIGLLSEEEEWTSILGAFIVSLSIVTLGVYKWKTQNPQQFQKVLSKFVCIKKLSRSNSNIANGNANILI